MENVCFEAVLVEPMLNSLGSPENLPLMVYFAGLTAKGSKAMKEINPKKLAKITPGPFVLVTPHQFDGHWWTISPRWGDGDFQPDIATRLVSWIKYLANFPGIDCNKVSLLGFSAGAYAATELLACRREVSFDCVVLGGVHGHGQPDLEGKSRIANQSDIREKWKNYMRRLKSHGGARGGIYVVHHREDQYSSWSQAMCICETLSKRQADLGYNEVDIVEAHLDKSGKKTKGSHNYMESTFFRAELFEKLLDNGRTRYSPHENMRGRRYDAELEESMNRTMQRALGNPRSGYEWGGYKQGAAIDADIRPYKTRRVQTPRLRLDTPSLGSEATSGDETIGLSVVSIRARIGWYVDAVELCLQGGCIRTYGGKGGHPTPPAKINPGEFIIAVEQHNTQVGYLGSRLIFELDSGRKIEISGNAGNKRKKVSERHEAPAEHFIHELAFRDGKLVGVMTAPINSRNVVL